MSVIVFVICMLCLGWTLRLVQLLENELHAPARGAAIAGKAKPGKRRV